MERRDTSIAISKLRARQLHRLANKLRLSPRHLVESWIVDGLKSLGCDERGVPYWVPPSLTVRRIVVDRNELIALDGEDLPLILLRLTPVESDPDPDEESEVSWFLEGLKATAETNERWEFKFTWHGGRVIRTRRQGGAVVIEAADQPDVDKEEVEELGRCVLPLSVVPDLVDAIVYLVEHPEATSASYTGPALRRSRSEEGKRMWEAYE